MSNKIKLVFFDVEGTLTGPNGRGHAPRLMSKLQELISQDIIVGLCTGRDSIYTKAIHRIFDLNGPIIAESGCELIPNYSRLETESINFGSLSESRTQEITKILKDNQILDKAYIDIKKKYMLTLLLNEFPRHKKSDLIALNAKVKGLLVSDKSIEVTHSSAAVDITPIGVDKGYAITKYCDSQKIKLVNTCYVGDSFNDLSAFDTVGKGKGFVYYVGEDEELYDDLEKYNCFRSKKTGSEGCIEVINNILKN